MSSNSDPDFKATLQGKSLNLQQIDTFFNDRRDLDEEDLIEAKSGMKVLLITNVESRAL